MVETYESDLPDQLFYLCDFDLGKKIILLLHSLFIFSITQTIVCALWFPISAIVFYDVF